ncbi:hypothetical protein [Anaerophaga thermohalophila]|uniref:hypothetical protein n=1 Tax=Anaerophaga thermohalophila TaxID=177400 RepID=UPI000237D5FA|nr:hypothetical protein [Anaerophaga thermohalophila]
MTKARVEILNEVSTEKKEDWNLCFQNCIYQYDNGIKQSGFRFIWRRPNGKLQPARGQARIPDKKLLFSLLEKAKEQGWF